MKASLSWPEGCYVYSCPFLFVLQIRQSHYFSLGADFPIEFFDKKTAAFKI